MKTQLTIDNIEARLRELTVTGDPKIMGTPFYVTAINNSSKPFLGEFDSTTFELTKNTSLLPTPYIIEGTYNSTADGTELNYKIKPIWFGHIWLRVFPIIALVIINWAILKNPTFFPTVERIIFNAFGLLMFSPILIVNFQKKKMERDFVNEFKLGNINCRQQCA
ncbi:MAG: hypothetical protein JST46_13855 [Bacteroidetes bacterium]|nr:hypothetical protein [Bacteroidota bacterium]